VIRLSGQEAIQIVNSVFPSKDLSLAKTHTAHVGKLMEGTKVIDEVVITLYRAPKSYTGEEVVEISCHGSPFIQDSILQSMIHIGARMAKPGEFTQRAFLNGKLDLTQAEAVADLIASNTEASRKAAIYNLKGGFSSDLQLMREKLIKFSALIELELDFSQEDVAFANKKELEILVQQLQFKTQSLLDSFLLGNVIKNGVQVAIVGKPNAGKSTLLNALLNENRALVSEVPGTTRDTVEEFLNIQGVLYKLIDTAGIRNQTEDAIEQMGIDKSKEKIIAADIVIALFDVNSTSIDQIQQWQTDIGKDKIILVGNKTDLADTVHLKMFENISDIVFIAAKNKHNIAELKNKITEKAIGDGLKREGTIITNARHVSSLKKLLFALNDVESGLIQNVTGDLLALDIRQALHYLGTITGEITNEDQLDFIFSKFCIGK
jgi:tRNA modification GTPase